MEDRGCCKEAPANEIKDKRQKTKVKSKYLIPPLKGGWGDVKTELKL
jgi:hypothetical protein